MSEANAPQVAVGCWVKLSEQGAGDEEVFHIVNPPAVDPLENRIPPSGPMGAALLGARPGEVVTVQAPAGELRFEVLEVGRD